MQAILTVPAAPPLLLNNVLLYLLHDATSAHIQPEADVHREVFVMHGPSMFERRCRCECSVGPVLLICGSSVEGDDHR